MEVRMTRIALATLALALVGALALNSVNPAPAAACMRNRTPAKLLLIDEALGKKALNAETIAKVKDLRAKASDLSIARKYHNAEAAADEALKILAVKWQEPPITGPIPRC
jgi:hypothetical protein